MPDVFAQLDKTLDSSVPENYGTMSIRVVILNKRHDATQADDEPDVPADLGDDEVVLTSGKTPVSGYLEDPKRGKECCVFLINGQRQDAWDNQFIQRDLDKKYLRNRMLVIVDLDGLKPESLAELMSGDRQGFFQGKVYHAMSTRLIATLKKDPEIERLEEEAENEISELKTGDEAVKQALDQLIEAHHSEGEREQPGADQPGPGGSGGKGFGKDKPSIVVVGPQDGGSPATGPYLVATPSSSTVRLHPDEATTVQISASPASAWKDKGPLHLQIEPSIDGLSAKLTEESERANLNFLFEEPDDWEDDQYPVETHLRATSKFEGHEEVRLLERRIVITKPRKRMKRSPIVLKDTPTFLKVTSRQPLPLTPGGADTHVRLRWDGKDALALGTPPPWKFAAKCLNLSTFPAMTFSKPSDGRFELLVHAPDDLATKEPLEFEVIGSGPAGLSLRASFTAQVIAIPTPRKLKKVVAEPSAQRKPPYKLLTVHQTEWAKGGCWDDSEWTADDAGCFHEPTEGKPLTLIINEDVGVLSAFRESLKSKKLEASTVTERMTRYTSHVAYHLYQMYLHSQQMTEAQRKDSAIQPPTIVQQKGEINRVASTLLKVMQVGR
jgi:hypothetical protein